MQRVILAMNPLEPASWEEHEVEDVRALIVERFASWPSAARVYHEHVAEDHDVTPATPEDVERLGALTGTVYVVNYPADPVTILIAVVAVAAVAAAVFLRPAVPNSALRNTQSESPNNALAERSNEARPNGRIPDIFGQVRSTPDLVAVPYKVFKSNVEYEVAYMCVGRGSYEVYDVLDDTTPISEIDGAQVAVYGPNTSPNSGAAQMTVGGAITESLLSVVRSNSVNGQTLDPPVSSVTQPVGPFTLNVSTLTKVYVNLVALNGLYKDDGTTQTAASVSITLELTPVNSSGAVTGAAQTFTTTLTGSATKKSMVAVTLKATPTFTGRCKARVWRTTPADTAFDGTVVDEVKWRDLYAVSPVTQNHFGNVTTVFSVTQATEGALALKNRKLNMLVARKVPRRNTDGTFSTTLYATTQAAPILRAICLDPFIGNRTLAEVDVDSIYDAMDEAQEYFGTTSMTEFCYTFDKASMSFEETVAIVAEAVFCVAYRRGSTIKLFLERETPDSVLLFNHRNKVPGSEVRTIRFGAQDDYDGVAYDYVSPTDDAVVTYYIPEDQSAVNPQKVQSVGVRNLPQAYAHAWRRWNKIRYQNVATEFTSTQEADLLVVGNRILVADNTRPVRQDGEIVSQSGLTLGLSQKFVKEGSAAYTIYLQHVDGTVEFKNVGTVASDGMSLSIPSAPRLPLVLEDDDYARTRYVIVKNGSLSPTAFIMTEKEPEDGFTVRVTAVNYDARYYANDLDFDGYAPADDPATPTPDPPPTQPPITGSPSQPPAVGNFSLVALDEGGTIRGTCATSNDPGVTGYVLYLSRLDGFTPSGSPNGSSAYPSVSVSAAFATGTWYARMAAVKSGWTAATLNFAEQKQVFVSRFSSGGDEP